MTKHPLRILPLGAAFLFCQCGGGPAQSPPPSLSPLPPPAPTPGLDPATAAAVAGPPPAPRAIQAEEFSISITVDNEVRNLISVPVHVISTDSQNARKLVEGGAHQYWQSPFSGANLKTLRFGQQGGATSIVRAPSVSRMDSVVLVADLAAPAAGHDRRIVDIPLQLDHSDPAAPVAHAIAVRLTRNGWQRER